MSSLRCAMTEKTLHIIRDGLLTCLLHSRIKHHEKPYFILCLYCDNRCADGWMPSLNITTFWMIWNVGSNLNIFCSIQLSCPLYTGDPNYFKSFIEKAKLSKQNKKYRKEVHAYLIFIMSLSLPQTHTGTSKNHLIKW